MYKITLYFLDHTEEKPSKYTFRCDSYFLQKKSKLLRIFNRENKGSLDRKHKVYTTVLSKTEREVNLIDTTIVEVHELGGKEKHLYRIQRKRTPENTIKFGI